MTAFAQSVRSLYDTHRFLDAYNWVTQQGIPWSLDGISQASLSLPDWVILGRLADKLGGRTLTLEIFKEARQRWPDHPLLQEDILNVVIILAVLALCFAIVYPMLIE